jgi:hypothetical protein
MTSRLHSWVKSFYYVLIALWNQPKESINEFNWKSLAFGDKFKYFFSFDDDLRMVFWLINSLNYFVGFDVSQKILFVNSHIAVVLNLSAPFNQNTDSIQLLLRNLGGQKRNNHIFLYSPFPELHVKTIFMITPPLCNCLHQI